MNVSLGDIVSCLNRFVQNKNVVDLQEARDLSRFYVEDVGKAINKINPIVLREINIMKSSQNSFLICLLQYLNGKDMNYLKLIEPQSDDVSRDAVTDEHAVSDLTNMEALLNKFENKLGKIFDFEELSGHFKALERAVSEVREHAADPAMNIFCKDLSKTLTSILSQLDDINDDSQLLDHFTNLKDRDNENRELLRQIFEKIAATINAYGEGMAMLSSNVGHMLHNLLTKQVEFHQQLLTSYRERLELQHTELRQQAFDRGRLSALVEAQEILLQRQKRQIQELCDETTQYTGPGKNEELIKRLEGMLQSYGLQQDNVKNAEREKEACSKIGNIPGFESLRKFAEPMEVDQDLWVTGARETVLEIAENKINDPNQLELLFNFILAMNVKSRKEADIQLERIRPSVVLTEAITSENLLHIYTTSITMLVSLDFQLMSHLENEVVATNVRTSFVKLTSTFVVLYAFASKGQKEQERRLGLENKLLEIRADLLKKDNLLQEEKRTCREKIGVLNKQLKECRFEQDKTKDLYDKAIVENERRVAAQRDSEEELRTQLNELHQGAAFEGQKELDKCSADLLKLRSEQDRFNRQYAELETELTSVRNALEKETKAGASLKAAFDTADMEIKRLERWIEIVESNAQRYREHIDELTQHLDPTIAKRMDDVLKTIVQNATAAVLISKRPNEDVPEDPNPLKRPRTDTA
ncbi:hypothetical protein HDE_00919 [Halotydeus destructor]|nr:hypothetical protein HDE_00919 [Halotydeus destructor]